MARNVLSGRIQASTPITDESKSVAEIQAAMFEQHLPMIHEAGKKGVQILCLQEIFNGPYFCPSQDPHWYDMAEPVPGPTTERRSELARRHGDGRPRECQPAEDEWRRLTRGAVRQTDQRYCPRSW